MRKFLRSLVMMALLAVPFVTQAQNMLTFDFEDGSVPASWTNDATNPWVITSSSEGNGHSGSYCIKSGNSGVGSSSSTISATFTFVTNGSISFLGGIYGEGTSTIWDHCIFSIDGAEQFNYGALAAWNTYSYDVTAGTHTFTWSYTKDGSVNPTGDAFFVDNLVVELNVTCPKPTDVTASNITADGAVINWTAGGSETAWKIYVDGVYQTTVNATTYTVSGLSSMSNHTVGVAASCSGSDESAPATVGFRTLCGDITVLPYVQDFEAASTGSSTNANFVECMTRLNNGSQYFGYPYVSGSSSYNHTAGGSRGLYWYNNTTTGTYGDYQYVVLPGVDPIAYPANTLWIKFWAKASSTSYHPVFEVGVMTDATDPTTFQLVKTINVEGTAWTEYITLLANYSGTGKFVAIRALRPTSNWYAYVDDITLDVAPSCFNIYNLAATVTPGAAQISWTYWEDAPSAPAGYEVSYKVNGTAGAGTTVNTVAPGVLLTSLDANTEYIAYVRANCGSDNGAWDSITFTTSSLPCLDGFGTVQVGDGTSTTQYLPGNAYYDYAISQQIYTAAEIGQAGPIQAIAVMPSSAPIASRNMEVYLGHVTVSTSTSFFGADDLTLVYSGTTNYVANEWYTFNFTTPFNYNGTDNLVVVFRDMTGDYESPYNYYYYHTAPAGSGASLYLYRDNTAYDLGTTGGTASSNRNNMLFIGTCDQYATCARPVIASVEDVTETAATITWAPGYQETAWDVAYRTVDATEWTVAATGVTATSYTFTGLTPATRYFFRVQHTCESIVYADSIQARTLCAIVLPFTEDFEDIDYNGDWPICWNSIISYSTDPSANYVNNHTEDGQYSMYLSSNNGYNMFSSLSVPTAGNNIYVSFWGRLATTTTGNPWIAYGVMTDPSDTNTFIAIDTIKGVSGWNKYEFSTANLDANATYYVAFKSYTRYTGNSYANAIDDVTIDTIPVYNVTLQTLTQVDDGAVWGTVEVSSFTPQWNDSVSFTATPGEYKRTAAWYAGADTTGATPLAIDTNNIKIRVTSDTTITVLFGYGQFYIAAAPNQERMGSVVADPASDNNMYDYLSEVTLTANAADGFMFKEWLNADDRSVFNTENPLTLTATDNYDLIARFVIDTFDITIVTENGSVEGADHGYMFGEVATITAVADEHYEFYYWADTVDGTSISADATLTFRMLGDTTFYPVFGPLQYTVTIDGNTERATYVIKHGDEENLTGTGDYTYGDTLTVIARNINENYDWMGWMESGATVTTDTVYTFVLEDNITFFANIPGGMNTVSFASNDIDMGSVKIDSVRLEDGTMVDYTDSTTLTVTLNYGSIIYATASPVSQFAQFNGWSHGTPDLMALSAAFNVVSDTTIYANFGFQVYNVTLNIEPALTGSAVAEPAAPEYGETVTVTATAEPHWVFANWTDTTGAVVSTDNPYTTGLLFEDLELTANFVRDSHNVVAVVADETHGTTEVTNAAAEVASRFMHTDMATVAFTEAYGYTFAGWSDGTAIVSTDNPYTFEVEDDVELTATVTPIEYTVTLIAEEGGNVNPATQQVAYLSTATLNYTEDYGYVFDFWANAAGEQVELPLVVTNDTTVVAHFKFDQFTITGTVSDDFRMMGSVAGSGEYDYQTEVTLTANANYGFLFKRWVDTEGNPLAVDGNEIVDIDDVDLTVKVLGNATYYAEFDYEPMDIIVNVNDPLFGTAATTVAAPYFFSQSITVEATAADHYHFVNWTNANGDEVSTDNPYTFILTEPVELTANFAIDTHTVTLVYNENAVTEINGAGNYTYGTDVEISLTEAYGFTFTGWDNGETLNPFTLHVESDTTIEALFTTNQYTVTAEVAAASTGMGTASGTNTVDYMSYVILTATPATGHDFVNWTNADGEVASTDLSFFVQATQDTTFYANFKAHAYTVTIASADEERGDVAWSAPTHIETLTDQTSDFANGTNTNSYVPVYGTWADAFNRCQFIYPAAMLSEINGAVINEMKFYTGSSSSYANKTWGAASFKVSIMEVPNETFATATFADVATATQVYQGTLSVVDHEMVITFATPYTYNGGNLLIEVGQTVKGTYSGCSFLGVTTTGASIGNYNSSAYASISPVQRNFLPKVTFTYDIDQVVLDPIAGVTYDDNDPDHIAYVDYQNSIAMEATAEYGYHFENWSNSIDATTSTDNPMTVASIEADVDYTANFAKNQYTITAAVGGDMAGTVSGTATVDYLETVTLTATPNADHRLLRWVNADDEILGTDLTLTVTAERDSTITAVFGYQVYTLTANTEDFEMGGVYVEDPASMGAPMEIFADDFESGIANWTNEGDATWTAGAGDYSSTTGSHSGSANAKITHSSTGNATKLISPVIDLSAYTSPELNFWFVNRSWGGDIDELNVYYRTSETAAWQSLQNYTSAHSTYTEATFTLPEPSATYQIAFEMVDSYGYGVAIDDVVISGILAGVAPSLATSYADVDYTTPVNIVATPAEHYHFVGWMNEAGDTVLTNATETITVLGDSTLTALFDGDVMPMTYQVNSAIRGAVEGPASGEYNTEVTFEAIAAHGYEFDRWEDGFEDNPRTVIVKGTDAENTYKAIFNFQTFDVDITVENGALADELDTREIFYGTQLTINAVADEHYNNWKGWKDADGNVVSTDNPYTFIVLEDVSLTGVFEIDSVNYTFASNDMTMGTVTSTLDAGLYAYETEVSLTATVAGEDYHFVDWNDGETAAERTVVLTQDTDLVANFALNQYNIATVAENGTAVWAGYDYAYPSVNITINAEDSYGDGWNGNTINVYQGGALIDSYTLTNGSTEVYNFSAIADGTVAFDFSYTGSYTYPEEVSFSIVVDGNEVYSVADGSTLTNGAVFYTLPAGTPAMTAVVPEGTTPVDPHTSLTFTATPDAGYTFVNWTTEDGTIVSSANPTIVEIVSDTTLVANFSTEVYTVAAFSTDTVKGIVSPATANLTVEQGALLTATPKYGYVFVNWTDKLGTELSTDAAFTLTDVTVDTVFANFNYDYFDVTVAANDNTWGSVTLNNTTVLTGNFPYGDTVTLRATAADGYYFVNWTNNAGAVVSDQLMCTFIVEADETYTANFADGSSYTITAVADDPAHGQVTGAGTYMAGTTVILTAVEFPNYFFTEWNDGNTDNPRTITVTADADYTAIYDTVAYNVTVNGVTEAVKYGVTYSVNAADSACRTFNGWSNGTEVVASGNQYTFVVTADITLTATYSDAITYTAEETVAYCGAYNWNGEDRTTTGDYTYTTTTAAGCDSTITLHLTVSDVMTSTDVQTSCGSFTWIDGNTYTESNNTATFTTTASNGCDSVITLNLTVNNPTGTSTTASECGSYTWNGTDYTTSGTYNYSYTDNNGCTVVDTLVLTINQPTTEAVSASACGSYAWHGETYTASGIYYDTLTNVAGCDSIVSLALTINQPVYSTISETACDSYVWSANGQTYTASGSYTVNAVAANGCDSIVTLNLTINQSASDSVEMTACDSYNWNGTDYTASGVYTWNGTSSNGCDSVVTLTLTINESVSTVVTETVDDNIVWNGVTYFESGNYTWTGVAANGCDSVVTLVLTVNGTQNPDTNYYTVSIETANPGMGTLTGAGTYAEGTIVTLTATPNSGYDFVCWMVGSDTVAVTREYTFTLVSDTTVTAVFVALPVSYIVTGLANDDAMGYVLGSGEYEAGSPATLTAQSNEGYHFVSWSNGHNEPTITFVVTGDITLTATFEANQPVTGIDESDMENVTIYSAESTIYVRGAEGKDVNVYDINGRTISSTLNAGDAIEFRMTATGVYLVKVGNAPAKRVLVVR